LPYTLQGACPPAAARGLPGGNRLLASLGYHGRIKDPAARIRELEALVEALENAVEEIRDATWTPKISLPALRRRIAQALAGLNKSK
jgi:hypothetical protein